MGFHQRSLPRSQKNKTIQITRQLNDGATLFIGVDQTGAVGPGKKPKPLPAAIAFFDNQPTLLVTEVKGAPLFLERFDLPSLQRLLDQAFEGRGFQRKFKIESSSTVLLVDCVFGLPVSAWPKQTQPGSPTLWSLFRRAATDTPQRKGYGLKSAATYFAELLSESDHDTNQTPYPVRECEILANANSVFRTHPFQKNIQCGTYRIWRDLGASDQPWVQIRHFEPRAQIHPTKPWMFEAYPSLFWREVLGLRTRDLNALPTALAKALPGLKLDQPTLKTLAKSADHADAAVLALGGLHLQRQRRLFTTERKDANRRLAHEGWIVGLSDKTN